jgi:hypothetical protein
MSDQLHLFGEGGHASRPKPRAARAPDPIFDALCHVCAITPARLTASGRGMLNRACKELREAQATPSEIVSAAQAYRERWNHTPTPGALARHFAGLQRRPAAVVERLPQGSNSETVPIERLRELAERGRSWMADRGS